MSERPRAILFDWDNTLVDSWQTIAHALNVTLAAMGQAPWSLDETKARVRHSLRDAFPQLFGERWPAARQIYLDAFTAVHLDQLAAADGAAALVDELAAHGLYLGVVSNKTGAILRREAAHLGWRHYFARLVGAGDAATDKPSAAPVALALDGSGIARGAAVWYVGDTALDMECAAAAGCVGVLLGGRGAGDDFARFPPALEFPGCAALARHLRAL